MAEHAVPLMEFVGSRYIYNFSIDCNINIPSFDCHAFKVIVKPVLSGHSKIDKTKSLMTTDSLMRVESIAECSPWSILQYF